MPVYLIHFSKPYHHARHYIGFCEDGNLQSRISQHASGKGSPLLKAVVRQGIELHLAHYWPDGDRNFERELKNKKSAPTFCPLCKEAT